MAKTGLGAESALSNVIPFPGHYKAPPSQGDQFLRACIAAEIAGHRYRLTGSLADLARLDGCPDAYEAAKVEHWRAFDEYVAATDALAFVPAPNRPFLDRKRRAIGKVWLTSEGERYERLRAGVAADEARLKVPRKAV